MDRRDFLKTATFTAASVFLGGGVVGRLLTNGGRAAASDAAGSTVYMTTEISSASIMRMYRILERPLKGKVAVKLSMGEPGGHNYLSPRLIKDLVHSVDGTFIDANTAYGGKRGTASEHMQTAKDHGFLDVAPVDILDAEGDISLPISGGKHLKEVRVGAHFKNYDSILVLSHFKGHAMAGFGGALKNIAIGISSRAGKCLVHTAGNSDTDPFDGPRSQDDFTESMAEASQGMIRAMGAENMVYINVMNNLSIDCDCSSNPAAPELPDIGILASHDPVAVDRASVDLIYAADAKKGAALRQRMEEKRGVNILTHAERMGIGSQRYNLVSMDQKKVGV